MSINSAKKDNILRATFDVIGLSKVAALMYLLIGIGFILVERSVQIFASLGFVSLQYGELDITTRRLIDSLYAEEIFKTTSAFMSWFAVGAILYILVWAAVVFFVDGYNDIVIANRFIHPTSFHKANYFASTASRFICRVIAGLFFLCLLVFFIIPIIPKVFYYSKASFSNMNTLSIVRLLSIPIFSLLLIQTEVVLLRLTLLRRRLLS